MNPCPATDSTYDVNGVGLQPSRRTLNYVSISIDTAGNLLRSFYNSLGSGDAPLESISDSVSVAIRPSGSASIDGFVDPKLRLSLPNGTKFEHSGSALCFKYRLSREEVKKLAAVLNGMKLGEISLCGSDVEIPDLPAKVDSFILRYITNNK